MASTTPTAEHSHLDIMILQSLAVAASLDVGLAELCLATEINTAPNSFRANSLPGLSRPSEDGTCAPISIESRANGSVGAVKETPLVSPTNVLDVLRDSSIGYLQEGKAVAEAAQPPEPPVCYELATLVLGVALRAGQHGVMHLMHVSFYCYFVSKIQFPCPSGGQTSVLCQRSRLLSSYGI